MPENLHLIVIEALVAGLVLCTIRGYFWVKDLHVWHAKEDDEGVKVWYVRKSLEDAVVRLAELLDRMDRRDAEHLSVQREFAKTLEQLAGGLSKLAEKIERMEP